MDTNVSKQAGFFFLALIATQGASLAAVAVTTYHNDLNRTGANPNETILTTSNVNAATFGKLFSRSVDGQIYAQPLYVPSVTIPGQGVHNVLYVCTEHDSVYAFDADDPSAAPPLWHVSLGTSLPASVVGSTKDLVNEIGITSTPVIDLSSNTMYVVAETYESSNAIFRLHALDITTGAEKFGGPAVIQGSVAGSGGGSSNGTLPFQQLQHWQRPALLLTGGVVYIGFASHQDTQPFHGWIFGYSATTLAQTTILCLSPDGDEGGVWQSGAGLAADANGFIYLQTGNGVMDVNTGGRDYGDSVVKLSTAGGLAVADYFSPSNQVQLADNDMDLGSSGPILIPGTSLGVGGGKDGRLFLWNTGNLEQFHSTDQVVQEWQATYSLFAANVYYNQMLYVWGIADSLKAFAFNGSSFNTTAVAESTFAIANGFPDTPAMSLSANGTAPDTMILWAAYSVSGSADGFAYPGILHAFDATNVSRELWNSNQNQSRDASGSWAKWVPPTVANGKVYLATFDNVVNVYGLLGTSSVAATGGTPQSAAVNTTFTTPLQATVRDASSDPLSGVTVTFTAPASGPGGTFSGSATATAVTNSSGVATAPTFTANGTAGSYTVSAGVTGAAPATFSLTNNAGAAASITATAGTPQSATVNTVFAVTLQAMVKDAYGNAVSGVTVTFTAPGSGAGGEFGSSSTAAVLTNSSGVATAPAFTASGTAGSYAVTASASGVSTPASFSLTNTSTAAATGGSLSGSGNSLATSANLTTEGTSDWVHFGDGGVPGLNRKSGVTAQISSYTVVGSGGVSAYSNDPRPLSWTDGTPTGSSTNNTDGVYISGVGNGFSITAPADMTSRILTVHVGGWFSGGTLTAHLSDGSAANFVNTTTAVEGQYDRNYTLTYNGASAGQTLTVTWVMSSGTGNVTLNGAALSFAVATPASITATAGTPQTATVNTVFAATLQATVKDSGSNPITGVTVTFAAPGSGASGTFSGTGTATTTAVTNSSGVATATAFTANGTEGSYAVTASVAGVATPASFSLTNNAGAAASVTATAGTPQSATVNAAFTTALQATARDASGNPASGVTVTFTAPGSGASGKFGSSSTATAVTNSSGVATAPTFTANGTAGSYTVSAGVTGAAPATFSLTNNAGAAASIAATAGTPQSATVNTVFAVTLQAMVKDAYGNAVSGVTVTFTAPGSGAGGEFGSSSTAAVLTNSSGVATAPAFTASGTAGSYAVTASASGVSTPASFSLTNTSTAAATGGSLSGSGNSLATSANLTTEGTSDWVHFGDGGVSGLNRKSGVTAQISSYTVVGSGGVSAYSNDPRPLSWTDGTPTSSAMNDADGVFISGVGNGFSITASADTTSRTLTVYVGGWFSGGTFTAHLSDGSAPDFVDTTPTASGQYDRNYTLTYNAASAGQTLTVTWVMASSTGGLTGNVTLNGAGLMDAPVTPASVTAMAGSPQSATVNTMFPTLLQAMVTDANGHAVSGLTVAFTAPGSGASGNFGGSTTATVMTNSTGVATAPAFAANGTVGSYTVTASVAGVGTPASFNLTNNAVVATGGSLSGSGNSLVTGANLTLEGTSDWVHWGDGGVPGLNRKSGVTAQIGNYTVVGSGGVSPYPNDLRPLSWTDGTPTASSTNNTDGLYRSFVGNGFSITAPADTTSRTLTVHVGGWDSGATVTAQLSDGSAANFVDTTTIVTGEYDRNYTLTYNAASAGQSLTVTWVMASGTGNVNLNGAALAVAGTPAASITPTAGTPQSATVNTAFTTALQATVQADGAPVSGVTVTFSALSSGASGTFSSTGTATATAVTNSSGIATAPAFTANGTAGGYTVTASVAGVGTPASFSLTNNAVVVTTGSLSGSGTSLATGANLTTEGTSDWVHWGDGGVPGLNRKSGVTAQISGYTVVGSGGVSPYPNDPRPLSWTDGTPTASSTNNTDGVYISDVGNGFSITAPADTTSRTLTVHVGGWFSGGTLTARLSDGSATNFVDTTTAAIGQYDRNYTLTYNAASAGQTLTVTWVMASGTGNVTLNGAGLN